MAWQSTQADEVNGEIEMLLASLSDAPGFKDIVRIPVETVKGQVRGGVSRRPWYLLPMIVCEAISGFYQRAIPASAALALFMAAGEVFDDVEDGDEGTLNRRYGPAIAINAATTLLILAEKALLRLKARGVSDRTIVRITSDVNSYYTMACCGQHLDLIDTDNLTSKSAYLKVALMKSASTIEWACHVGASVVTSRKEPIDLFTSFGRSLGLASQIANDVQGITSGSDIVKRKVSLPVIYALEHTEGETRKQLGLAFTGEYHDPDVEQIKTILFNCGAIHYAMLSMEVYRQQSSDTLKKLGKRRANIDKLQIFLE